MNPEKRILNEGQEVDPKLLESASRFINCVGKATEKRSPTELAKLFEEAGISHKQIDETIININRGHQSPGTVEDVFSALRFRNEK